MANEITISATLRCKLNGSARVGGISASLNYSGDNYIQSVQNVGTSAELVSFGDISGAPGLVLLKNRDSTNYVEIALDSGMTYKFGKLKAGDVALWTPASATLYAKADTAACQVEVLAIEGCEFSSACAVQYAPPDSGVAADVLVSFTPSGGMLQASGAAVEAFSADNIQYAEHVDKYLTTGGYEAPFGGLVNTYGPEWLFAVNWSSEATHALATDSGGTHQFALLGAIGGVCLLPYRQAAVYGGSTLKDGMVELLGIGQHTAP